MDVILHLYVVNVTAASDRSLTDLKKFLIGKVLVSHIDTDTGKLVKISLTCPENNNFKDYTSILHV